MTFPALVTDVYFWVGLVFFILSIVGIFWILNSLQNEPDSIDADPEKWQAQAANAQPEAFSKTVRIAANQPNPGPANIQTLARQVNLIEETLTKIEKKFDEQNTDQMNEIAGQVKLMVQMLKTIQGGGGSESVTLVSQKVDKIYTILSSLSQNEQK